MRKNRHFAGPTTNQALLPFLYGFPGEIPFAFLGNGLYLNQNRLDGPIPKVTGVF